jgi:ABC-type glutathione transport system ATPase component
VVRQIADDVVVLRNGRIVEQGTADEVLSIPRDPYTQLLLASTPRHGWKPVARRAFGAEADLIRTEGFSPPSAGQPQ